MKKSLGNKRKEISDEGREQLLGIFKNFEENEFCKVYPNEFFGYTKVTIEQPKIENGEVLTDRQGNPRPDPKKRDNERVPLTEDIEEYFQREVKPHLPDSFMNEPITRWGMRSTSQSILQVQTSQITGRDQSGSY